MLYTLRKFPSVYSRNIHGVYMVYAVVVLLLEEAFFSIPRISFMFCSCELDGEPAQHSNNKQTIFP